MTGYIWREWPGLCFDRNGLMPPQQNTSARNRRYNADRGITVHQKYGYAHPLMDELHFERLKRLYWRYFYKTDYEEIQRVKSALNQAGLPYRFRRINLNTTAKYLSTVSPELK